jgi:DNA mismatch repair protein MutL
MEALLDSPPAFAPLPGRAPERESAGGEAAQSSRGNAGSDAPAETSVRFLGTAFGLFLLAERGDRLYLIDQHAAHERLLYDRFHTKPPARQELLVPHPFRTESEADDAFLEAHMKDLAALGLVVEKDGTGSWKLEATPEAWRAGDEETVRAILDLRNAGEDFAERWMATLACKAAIKDGDVLDASTAAELAAAALALPIPRCPHGRPVWTEITREALFKAVRRIE